MSERLTQQTLETLHEQLHNGSRRVISDYTAGLMTTELIERRAQDLSAEEHNALRSLQRELIAESETLADYGANVVVVAALSKLLTRGNR